MSRRAFSGPPLAERLDVVPSAGDANAVALNKLDEQENVLRRLSPGQTHVVGGLSVRNAPSVPSASAPTQGTHAFSLSAWQRANPKGDPNAARAAATAQGYQVVQ